MQQRRYTFRRSHRLSGAKAFSGVYDAKVKQVRGPLVVFSVPNGLPEPRLGLSVGRRVGTSPRRHRIKRLIREAFRFLRHDFPRGYDWVVVVRPHEPLALAEYQKLLSAILVRSHNGWIERERKAAHAAATGDGPVS